ncbi:MAG TPA: flagellar motor switch protein FliN [Gaiellales bacterium]|jgi:flagellar motor switch protein FliN/FliY|nr:flagellar motor switch protein FliN [Gaiellales bacterium]
MSDSHDTHAGEALAEPPSLDELGPPGAAEDGDDLTLVLDVHVEIAVEIGRTAMTIRETMALAPGSVVALKKPAGEPVELLVNGKRFARGEVVTIDEEFGLRITELVPPAYRVDTSLAA